MHIIDSHFHWWPTSVFETLLKRKGFPRVERDGKGGYIYHREENPGDYVLGTWDEWFHLDKQLEHMDSLGHDIDVVCSIGPFSVAFSEIGRAHV